MVIFPEIISRLRNGKKAFLQYWFRNSKPFPYRGSYQYENAVCAIVKNEADILEEWVLLHLSVGMDHVVLVDNNSTDKSRQLLEPYEKAGLVEWKQMLSEPFAAWKQMRVYTDILREYRGKTRWMWFLDSDEFLLPSRGSSIRPIMQELARDPGIGAVAVNWLFFGTSNLERLPHGEWHTGHLLRRAPYEWYRHKAVKSGLRPEAAAGFLQDPHLPQLYKNRRIVYANKEDYTGEKIDHGTLKVHHYWHRTEEFYRKVKEARRKLIAGTVRGPKAFKLHHDMHNQVEDPSMYDFIPEMKKIQQQVRNGSLRPNPGKK